MTSVNFYKRFKELKESAIAIGKPEMIEANLGSYSKRITVVYGSETIVYTGTFRMIKKMWSLINRK